MKIFKNNSDTGNNIFNFNISEEKFLNYNNFDDKIFLTEFKIFLMTKNNFLIELENFDKNKKYL